MRVIFLILVVVIAVTMFFDNKKRGQSLLACALQTGFIIIWGIVDLFILNLFKHNFNNFQDTYNTFGAVSIGLCVFIIPLGIMQRIINKNESTKADEKCGSWICSKCGNRNDISVKTCTCGYVMDKSCKKVSDVWKCPNCGQINSYKTKVCDCGAKTLIMYEVNYK